MTDQSRSAEPSTTTDDEAPVPERKRRVRATGEQRRGRVLSLRTKIATVIWLAAVICALFLAIGALIVALKMNQDNAIIGVIIDGAKNLDFGEFKKFTGPDAATKGALVNWGLAAVIYLVVGKIVDRIVRP